jgi:hypothetical protein
MCETTQSTLVTDPDATDTGTTAVNSDDTFDDDGLLDKVRDSDHPAVRCGYCQEVALAGYKRSAHGRAYCPECGTVKGSDQRSNYTSTPYWV